MGDWSIIAVIPRGEQFAVIARGFSTRNINFPGGDKTEQDQTPADTAVREILEETGLYTTAEFLRLIDTWKGSRGQRVYAFYITGFQGRLRSSPEGKTFWTAQTSLLISSSSEFRDRAKRLLEKLTRMSA
jgi:8-oxo-dGTP pyrophosphatase MutT (NUDIX family)